MRQRKEEWLGNIKGDLLGGIVVCMALIPEAIGFSIVAGVDPMVGVYASFCISLMDIYIWRKIRSYIGSSRSYSISFS